MGCLGLGWVGFGQLADGLGGSGHTKWNHDFEIIGPTGIVKIGRKINK